MFAQPIPPVHTLSATDLRAPMSMPMVPHVMPREPNDVPNPVAPTKTLFAPSHLSQTKRHDESIPDLQPDFCAKATSTSEFQVVCLSLRSSCRLSLPAWTGLKEYVKN